MKPLALSVRERAVAGMEAGQTAAQISRQLEISPASVRRFVLMKHSNGSVAPRPREHTGPQPVFDADRLAALEELRSADPGATLQTLAERLEKRCGIRVSVSSIGRALRRLGAQHVRVPRASRTFHSRASARTVSKPYAEIGARELPTFSDRRAYPTDLSDAEWEILEPLIPKTKPGGRPEHWPRRELVNAMLYALRNGCTWRALPHDLPPWSTVYSYFRKWRIAGLWKKINNILRGQARRKAGRAESPTAAIMDSQSVHTTEKGGSTDMTAPSV